MFIELENITEFHQFQPWLNTYCSSKTFPKTPIIFTCFPQKPITLYTQYNNFMSPVFLPRAEVLELKPPMGIGCLFLTETFKVDLEELGQKLVEYFRVLDESTGLKLDYTIETRAPRFDLHALDSGGSLVSVYCQGISLDFLVKPDEGLIQVACTKLIPFKGNNAYYMTCALQFLKELLAK